MEPRDEQIAKDENERIETLFAKCPQELWQIALDYAVETDFKVCGQRFKDEKNAIAHLMALCIQKEALKRGFIPTKTIDEMMKDFLLDCAREAGRQYKLDCALEAGREKEEQQFAVQRRPAKKKAR